MELYIFKSAACLVLFFLFYKVLLENTTLHTIKRIFLLGSLILSLLIPFITFTEYIEVAPITEVSTETPITNFNPITTVVTTPTNYTPYIVWSIYFLGVVFFSFRFLKNSYAIFQKVKNNPTLKNDSIWHVLLKHPVTPHSFFNYIFFSKTAYEADEIPQEVIVHEKAHVTQKHSWDILFFELLRIVFWFNPLLYFIKHSIKLNHEFLADRAVLNQGADTRKYQTILLDFSSSDSYRDPSLINLAHSINYSSTRLNDMFSKSSFGQVKKRFTVMKTRTSKKAALLKGLLILPFVAVLIFGFSSTKTIEKVNNNYNFQEKTDVPATQVTTKQLEIYTKLAKKYNAVPVVDRKIGWKDLKTLENIYRKMSDTQKTNALPFPECLPGNQTSWEEEYAKSFNDGAARNNKKSIVITINVSEIMVNGKATSLKNFAKEVDKVTKNWTVSDFQAAHPSVLVAATPTSFMEKLDAEFKKTRYFKANKGISIIPTSPPPPPPAPDAPKVIKGVNDNAPNIPPPPPAPKVYKGKSNGMNVPPPPPPPANPLDHIVEMAKKNATFYFDGTQITSDKAVEVIKNNKDLNIQTTGSDSKNPKVKISTKPITLDSDNTKSRSIQNTPTLKMTLMDPPNLGPEINSNDPSTMLEALAKRGSTFYLDGGFISKKEAETLLEKHKVITIDILDTPHDKPSILFDAIDQD
jgi:bla regulator protein blaR1